MNFQGHHAKFQRLSQEHAAWKLLRADNAPMILAFLTALFEEESEVAFGKARITLEAELQQGRELGLWETESNASTYLRHWIQSGWLRELDDFITKTDACEIALRFADGLDQRATGT